MDRTLACPLCGGETMSKLPDTGDDDVWTCGTCPAVLFLYLEESQASRLLDHLDGHSSDWLEGGQEENEYSQ